MGDQMITQNFQSLNITYKIFEAIPVSRFTECRQVGVHKGVRAVGKYVRGAPSKVRRVLNTIRGKTYEEALMVLEYMPYASCEPILKCLVSAASNAVNNFDLE